MDDLNTENVTGNGALAVSEIFGPTFQGEGPSLGRGCFFLRLAGCNQHCSWCDTPYTWDWTGRNGTKYDPSVEVTRMRPEDVLDGLVRLHPPAVPILLNKMLVVSGGEPLLQQRRLIPVLEPLVQFGWRIEVETAGTIKPTRELTDLVNQFNISPKLENSGNDLKTRYKPAVLSSLQGTGKAAWKFVVTCPEDLDEVEHVVNMNSLNPVYIMPEGKNREDVERCQSDIVGAVLNHGWNLTTRLHVLLYGNRRGV